MFFTNNYKLLIYVLSVKAFIHLEVDCLAYSALSRCLYQERRNLTSSSDQFKMAFHFDTFNQGFFIH